ncbi:MAG: glycosyltransferase [Candidatus Hydrogenedentes bacterium]|nr:glycosyltransferase [Candidatus Hydrogenedentota bacterium]
MPKLSVVMIVKNEAECLPQCLAGVRAIADELVICDTGSTDRTIAVAESFGALVYPVPWIDDFALARNSALAHASGDWILHLDADEALDPGGAARLRELADADGLGADAIEVILANYCNDIRAWRWRPVTPGDPMARGYAGCIPVPLLRLFRNGRGFEYREPVHENITESVVERGGIVRTEPVIIHHYGYACAPEKARGKARVYLEIGRKKTKDRPTDPKAWHDLAEQALAAGFADEAEAAARQAVNLAPGNIAPATTLANLLLTRGEFDSARKLLEPFAGPDAPAHVLTALGALAFRQGRMQDARALLEQAVAMHPWALMAWQCLARVLDAEGDPAGARAMLENAARKAPGIKEFGNLLQAHDARRNAQAALDKGLLQEALQQVNQALALDPEDPLSHLAAAAALEKAGQPRAAETCRRRACQLCPAVTDRQHVKAQFLRLPP